MKIGICGTGGISHEFMENSRENSSIEINFVYHREIHKAEAFASKYGIENATDNYDELLLHVDLVYIALPNSLHYSFSKIAINKNVHVISEKPICINVLQFDELIGLAELNDVMIFEMNRVTYLPNTLRIKELMKNNNGKSLITVNYCKRSRRYDEFINGLNPNVFTTQFSGGALYDLGIYAIHFIVFMLGKPESMTYKTNILSSGVDGNGIALLEYPETLVSVNLSKISNGESNILIQGENYTIKSESAPSIIKDFTFTDNSNSTYYNEHSLGVMDYGIRGITGIIARKDMGQYKEITNHTREVVEILENLRLQNNIVF